MDKGPWPKVFAYLGLALIGFVFAYYATSVATGGITAALLGSTSAGLDLLTTSSAALLVGIAMFAVFGYLALRLGWSQLWTVVEARLARSRRNGQSAPPRALPVVKQEGRAAR